MTMLTVRDIIEGYEMRVLYDEDRQLNTGIAYVGPGWYSLDDNEMYQYDQHCNTPTFARIRVLEDEE